MSNLINTVPELNPSASFYQQCSGTLWMIKPQTATNLCINPSFEIGTVNWSGSGGGVLSRVNDPWSGAWAVSWSGGTSLSYGTTTPVSLTSGQQVAVSFYMKQSYPLNAVQTYTVQLINTSGSVVVAQWQFRIEPNQWKRFVGISLITATSTYTITIIGTDFVLDAVQIETVNGHTATTYFDGSYTGFMNNSQISAPQYSWLGQAHASASIRNTNTANGGLPINLYESYGFMLMGIINGDNPSLNNQLVQFNGTDGAALTDILYPPRALSIVGRIYGETREELHQKLSNFQQYFVRDATAYRQPISFIFQHERGSERIGSPLSFSGVISNSFQIPLGNDFGVQVSIQINMLDPFFYGHDMAKQFSITSQRMQNAVFSYIPEFTQETANTFTQYLQSSGYVNNHIRAIAVGFDGTVYIGGDFTSVGGTAANYIATWNPITKTFGTIGTTPSTVLNGTVSALAITPDGIDLIIGGAFTTANGIAANRVVRYTIASATWSTMGGGAGGGVNGAVYAIAIKTKRLTGTYPYEVYIGGAFTATTAGAVTNRIAYFLTSTSTWTVMGTGNGMNGDVYALEYNNNLDRLYIGGAFTQSQGGAITLNYIAYINITSIATTIAFYIGFNNSVYSLYSNDVDNTLYVGGSFTALAGGATALLRAATFSGVSWSQVDIGIGNGIVYDIVPYKNGILLLGTFTIAGTYTNLFDGIAWFNGQSLYPMSVSGRGAGFYSAYVLGTGTLILGGVWTGASQYFGTGDLELVQNTSTAASKMKWYIYSTSDATDFVIHNLQNVTQQTNISLKLLPIQRFEQVIIDTSLGIISSDLFGDQTRFVLNASSITNMRVQPGSNYLVAMFSCTLPLGVGQRVDFCAIWKQTYNNLFDGIDAI